MSHPKSIPSVFNYSFIISPNERMEHDIRQGQYCFVFSELENGLIVGTIEDFEVDNEYFSNTYTIKNFQSSELSLSDYYPSNEWECELIKVSTLGVIKLQKNERKVFNHFKKKNIIDLSIINPKIFSRIDKVGIPVKPGSSVYPLNGEYLRNFLGLNSYGLNIGNLKHSELEVSLDVDRLFRKHLAILAQSGAGKSYLLAVLLEELLTRSLYEGTPAMILIDVHGEYKFLSERPEYLENFQNLDEDSLECMEIYKKINYFHGSFLQIDTNSLNEYDFLKYQPEISRAQVRELGKIIKTVKAKANSLKRDPEQHYRGYDLEDIINEIELTEEIAANVKKALVSWLYSLSVLRLFGKSAAPKIDELAKVGQLTIIDLSPLISNKKKQILLHYIVNKLFRKRINNEIPPFILFLEEAHNFLPEQGGKHAIAKSILEKIAREGRKFFAQLVLISQRPVHLSTTALSQCNTQIIMRITNPYDLDHIKATSEALTKNATKVINTLPTGNALIMGAALNYPVFVQVRKRFLEDLRSDQTLAEVCKKFLNYDNIQKKQTESKEISNSNQNEELRTEIFLEEQSEQNINRTTTSKQKGLGYFDI